MTDNVILLKTGKTTSKEILEGCAEAFPYCKAIVIIMDDEDLVYSASTKMKFSDMIFMVEVLKREILSDIE